MNNRPIHFLVFLNRSGSTLLARELNRFQDIAVGIEEGVSKKTDRSFKIKNKTELKTFIDQCYKDYKFQNWGLDQKELLKQLSTIEYPVDYSSFLSIALNLYFIDDPAKVIIHKSRKFFSQIGQNDEMFPNSKFVVIIRDPRAVFSSQRKSIDSRTGKVMNDDIVSFCISYKNFIHRLKSYKHNLNP